MKRLLTLTLTVAMLLAGATCFSACDATEGDAQNGTDAATNAASTSNTTATQSPETNAADQVATPTIYIEYLQVEAIGATPQTWPDIASASTLNLQDVSSSDYITLDSTNLNATSRQFTIGEQSKTYQYQNTEYYTLSADSVVSNNFNRAYDIYKSEDGKIELQYLHNSDTLICYTNSEHMGKDPEVEGRGSTVQLTDDEAIQIMADFIIEFGLQTQEVFDEKFALSRCEINPSGHYSVSFTKMIHGYKTNDFAVGWVAMDGTVMFCGEIRRNMFDDLEDTITLAQLDAARAALDAQIAALNLNEVEAEEPTIIANLDGVPYLMIRVWYKDANGFSNAFELYASLQ